MSTAELKEEIKGHIIVYCNLLGVKVEDIADDTPIFVQGLGLDSIDSLELVVMIEREYGIRIENQQVGRKVLIDVNHIAKFIEQSRAGEFREEEWNQSM